MSTAFKKIFPLLNRVVIRKLEQTNKTASGIIVNKGDANLFGEVVEAGPGQYDSKGSLLATVLKSGDKVLLPDFGGQKVSLNNEELFIYRDSDIIAKVE
jgi:chaperonin GroES